MTNQPKQYDQKTTPTTTKAAAVVVVVVVALVAATTILRATNNFVYRVCEIVVKRKRSIASKKKHFLTSVVLTRDTTDTVVSGYEYVTVSAFVKHLLLDII